MTTVGATTVLDPADRSSGRSSGRTPAADGAPGAMAAGARAMAPMLVAYVPFGLVVGAAVAASANPVAAWLGTSTIYGGAAHLAVLDVLAGGAGWVAAAAVGLLVNARLAAYAGAMAPHWRGTPLRQRLAAGVMLTDAPWALARPRTGGHNRFYLGAALTLFLGWPVLVTLGVLVGDQFSASPTGQLLPPLTLGVLVVTQLGERPVRAGVAAATATAVATASLSAGLSLLLAGVAGVLAAQLSEVRS